MLKDWNLYDDATRETILLRPETMHYLPANQIQMLVRQDVLKVVCQNWMTHWEMSVHDSIDYGLKFPILKYQCQWINIKHYHCIIIIWKTKWVKLLTQANQVVLSLIVVIISIFNVLLTLCRRSFGKLQVRFLSRKLVVLITLITVTILVLVEWSWCNFVFLFKYSTVILWLIKYTYFFIVRY